MSTPKKNNSGEELLKTLKGITEEFRKAENVEALYALTTKYKTKVEEYQHNYQSYQYQDKTNLEANRLYLIGLTQFLSEHELLEFLLGQKGTNNFKKVCAAYLKTTGFDVIFLEYKKIIFYNLPMKEELLTPEQSQKYAGNKEVVQTIFKKLLAVEELNHSIEIELAKIIKDLDLSTEEVIAKITAVISNHSSLNKLFESLREVDDEIDDEVIRSYHEQINTTLGRIANNGFVKDIEPYLGDAYIEYQDILKKNPNNPDYKYAIQKAFEDYRLYLIDASLKGELVEIVKDHQEQLAAINEDFQNQLQEISDSVQVDQIPLSSAFTSSPTIPESKTKLITPKSSPHKISPVVIESKTAFSSPKVANKEPINPECYNSPKPKSKFLRVPVEVKKRNDLPRSITPIPKTTLEYKAKNQAFNKLEDKIVQAASYASNINQQRNNKTEKVKISAKIRDLPQFTFKEMREQIDLILNAIKTQKLEYFSRIKTMYSSTPYRKREILKIEDLQNTFEDLQKKSANLVSKINPENRQDLEELFKLYVQKISEYSLIKMPSEQGAPSPYYKDNPMIVQELDKAEMAYEAYYKSVLEIQRAKHLKKSSYPKPAVSKPLPNTKLNPISVLLTPVKPEKPSSSSIGASPKTPIIPKDSLLNTNTFPHPSILLPEIVEHPPQSPDLEPSPYKPRTSSDLKVIPGMPAQISPLSQDPGKSPLITPTITTPINPIATASTDSQNSINRLLSTPPANTVLTTATTSLNSPDLKTPDAQIQSITPAKSEADSEELQRKKSYQAQIQKIFQAVKNNENKYEESRKLLTEYMRTASIQKGVKVQVETLIAAVNGLDAKWHGIASRIMLHTLSLLLNPLESQVKIYSQFNKILTKNMPNNFALKLISSAMMVLGAIVATMGVLICTGTLGLGTPAGAATLSAGALLIASGLGIFPPPNKLAENLKNISKDMDNVVTLVPTK